MMGEDLYAQKIPGVAGVNDNLEDAMVEKTASDWCDGTVFPGFFVEIIKRHTYEFPE